MRSYKYDYRYFVGINRIIASGVSPLDNSVYYTKHAGFLPIQYLYRLLPTLLGAGVVRLGVEVHWATFVVMPFVFIFAFVLSVWFFAQKLNLNERQFFVFFGLLVFVNDYALIKLIGYAEGELLALAFALVGLAYFLTNGYLRSVPFFALSALAHSLSITVLVALIPYSLIKNRRRLSRRFVLTTVLLSTVVGLELFYFFKPQIIRWGDAPDKDPTLLDPDIIWVPPVLKDFNESKIDQMNDEGLPLSGSELLQTSIPFYVSMAYPLTYPYWCYVPRNALNVTLPFLGYKLSQSQVEGMASLQISAATFVPLMVFFLYCFGGVAIFLFAVLWTDRLWVLWSYLAELAPFLAVSVLSATMPSFLPTRMMMWVLFLLGIGVVVHERRMLKVLEFRLLALAIVVGVARAVLWTLVVLGRSGY